MRVTDPSQVDQMPIEIKDAKEFIKLASQASECVVKRHGNEVKLKLRASRLLTLKVSPQEADDIIKQIKCPITDAQKPEK